MSNCYYQPAFPTPNGGTACEGMTLRDYFAAKAMQGIIGNSELLKHAIDGRMNVQLLAHNSSAEAYLIADAMLRERYK